MIDELRLQYLVSTLYRVLQVSSRGYYQRRKAPVSAWQREEYRLELEIRAAHRRTRETCGPERIREDFAANGIEVGIHRLKRIRKKLGLKRKLFLLSLFLTVPALIFQIKKNLLSNKSFMYSQIFMEKKLPKN